MSVVPDNGSTGAAFFAWQLNSTCGWLKTMKQPILATCFFGASCETLIQFFSYWDLLGPLGEKGK